MNEFIKSSKVEILGIPVHNYTMLEFNNIIRHIIDNNFKCMILALNIYSANLAFKLDWFFELYKNACYVHCDGEGIRLAAKLLGKEIKEKITFNRWIWELARISEKQKYSWFLIGSSNETISSAVNRLRIMFPELNIVGYRNGFFKSQDEIDNTVREISLKSPNILILGMGQPLQEEWLLKNSNSIHYNVALGGGAVFEYVSGKAKMTPTIFYNLKLEWLYRLINEPIRLFHRYIIGIPIFFYKVIIYKIKHFK